MKHAGNMPQHKAWLRLPAIRALLMQFLALAFLLLLLRVNAVFFHIVIPGIVAVLLEGVCAALLSRWAGLASWWWVMQCLFAPALFVAATLHLPSWIYLAAFIISLALYWSTFRTQVPFYPSGRVAWDAVEALLPPQPIRFIDIGSGFGGLVSHMARRHPKSYFVGIELAPLPWLASRMRAWLWRNSGVFLLGDYDGLDFADFDVVFAYLSPAAMPLLWQKAKAEMRPGSLLLSYEFTIPGVQSQITNISAPNRPILYGWKM